MPFVLYFLATVFYFTFFIRGAYYCNRLYVLTDWAFKLLIIVNMACFEVIEILQWRSAGFLEYFNDFWNILDQLSFVLNLVTLTLHAFDADVHTQKLVAAAAIFFMYSKLFYWMRLFDSLAAFIRMLTQIFIDIVPFSLDTFCLEHYSDVIRNEFNPTLNMRS